MFPNIYEIMAIFKKKLAKLSGICIVEDNTPPESIPDAKNLVS